MEVCGRWGILLRRTTLPPSFLIKALITQGFFVSCALAPSPGSNPLASLARQVDEQGESS